MGLRIKNPESERLAKALAARTGETVTGAITSAVREKLERLDSQSADERHRRLSRVMAIARDSGKRWTGQYATLDHGELLYDELGLPR